MIYVIEKLDKKLHPQGDGVLGHGEWGMGHGEEVTNAQCPKRRGDYPSPPTRGWSFPSLSIKMNINY
ncbi:hypothetical protein H6G81_29165 [Scytonema hofmannii FACHB-248]|uniref:Uncharacterized protein n=1 Tax=Scytonema hofmannii FACHB-248 TaxID=1842502 RepID=A0ABR8GZP0_9CYAN|nr:MULTISPECIES: hypothetical protein [Nostocales]MBD2608481.1 hypothetical protein [Scytonema hofmannii FACHB-248]